MSWPRRLFSRNRMEIDLDKELRFHFESQVADKVRSGLSENEARRLTRLEFGGIDQIKEDCRERRGTLWVESLIQDIRYGLRQLHKSPGFTFITIISLALGIGANTAIFTLLNAILLRPLPVQNPGELLLFGDGLAQGSTNSVPDGSSKLFSYPFFHDFRLKDTSFSGIAAVDSSDFRTKASIAGGAYETTHVTLVSGSYFSVLGVPAVFGRTIGESDDSLEAAAGPVAVASYTWFQRHFNGDPSALGKVIRIQSHDYTLVGVARPGFFGTTVGQSTDLFIPISMQAFGRPGWKGLDVTMFRSLYLIGRLKPGVSAAQASAETNLLFKQIPPSSPLPSSP